MGESLTDELSNYLQDFSHTQLKHLWATRTTNVHWKQNERAEERERQCNDQQGGEGETRLASLEEQAEQMSFDPMCKLKYAHPTSLPNFLLSVRRSAYTSGTR